MTLPGAPTPATYLRAALPAVPGIGSLPGVRRTGDTLPTTARQADGVAVDTEHLARYSAVCGFGLRADLPLTYPHVLAFGLQMQLLTGADFPFPAVGLVHVANRFEAARPLSTRERLDLTVRAADLRLHPRGHQFSVVTQASSDGELVWRGISTYLRRGPGGRPSGNSPGPRLDDPPVGPTTWRVPGDTGRRYAAVSGDRNPIHLTRLTARAFGFPRPIAHGMWTAARCLAAIEGRLPAAPDVDIAFAKPVLLPTTVAFGYRAMADGGELAVTSSGGERVHLVGTVRAGGLSQARA